MNRQHKMRHAFVEFMPDDLENGVLYVSVKYATASHKCCCGCGHEVVTPLTPTDWKLIFDGESVSLEPSIGNWSFPCKAHYWITNGRIDWSFTWDEKRIEHGRKRDAQLKTSHYGNSTPTKQPAKSKKTSWLNTLIKKIR